MTGRDTTGSGMGGMHGFVARVRGSEGSERGFYMVWFALTMVALIGFAGLGLEFTRWNSIGTRVQKAADAAALSGAVFMPENIGNQAFNTAKSTASKNGYTNGANGVVITTAAGALTNQLKVTIAVPTKNPFGAIVGYGNSTIVKSAVAEYQLPQNLGSPENRYGNDPETAITQPQFWGNVFGRASHKGKGDAVQGAAPTAATSFCDADGCPGGINRDYSANGYFYGIDVGAGAGALNVEVFDPAFVAVGDTCTAANTGLNAAAALTAAQIPGYSGTTTPAERYAAGAGSPFCTGDMQYNDGATWTTWTLRSPDITTWDPTNNPIVCQAEFPGFNDPDNIDDRLQDNTAFAGTSPARRFNEFFRQWVRLCSVAVPEQGTYFLQVQTAKKIDGTTTPLAGGANRYSVRVGRGSDFSASNGLKLYGNQRMGIYANASGADTRFYLTRIPPGHAGHTLLLEFFDTGDASQAGTITVLPPPDSNVSGGAFAGCQYTPPPGNSNNPPWGTLTATGTGCAINNVSSGNGWNGQWVTLQVPIPEDYTCNDAIATGCWARLRFSYPAGTNVTDTTTWQAFILGDPVRLIQ